MTETLTEPTSNDKELMLTQKKAALANAEREVIEIGKTVSDVTGRLTMLEKQLELSKKMHEIALKEFEPVQTNWKFQSNPEYIRLQKEWSDTEQFFKQLNMTQQIGQVKSGIEAMQEQIQSQKNSAEQLREEIAKLEG